MNPHTVLGVAPDATPEQIKSAYRKLVMKHHPDKGGDQQEFQKIQEAYDTITKPKPQQNENNFEHPFRRYGFAWNFSEGGEDFWNHQRERRNSDFTTQVMITLEQAYEGTQLSLSVNDRIITINTPRGVQHGQRLSVQNEGGKEHADLPQGHLHVLILIKDHPVFQVNGPDLFVLKDVDVLDMLIGCELAVTTIGGDKMKVKVPSNSQPTTRLRVSGKGMPIQNTAEDAYGALYIVLNPTFPTLTDDQIDKLRELKA